MPLTYICPITNLAVKTSIHTTEAALMRMSSMVISVWCPHCQAPHKITAADAKLSDFPSPAQ
jgi:hypothetical protein